VKTKSRNTDFWLRVWVCACMAIAAGIISNPVLADGAEAKTEMEIWAKRFEIRGGILGHDTGFLRQAGPRNHVYAGNVEVLFPSPSVLSFAFDPRPNLGISVAPDADGISFVYAGLNWDIPIYGSWFLLAGVGGSLNNADRLVEADLRPGESKRTDRLIGCHALFHLSLGFGYRITENTNLHFYGDHISNANLCDNNEGLDQWGVRLGYAF
jgi:lipid A 3-O-deacylase